MNRFITRKAQTAPARDSSFTCSRLNPTTFVVREDDIYREHPLIYVKIHSKAQAMIVTDTGCDAPSPEYENARYVHLRDYLENCPIESNGNLPLNPQGQRRYIIVFTHCHYDHIGGVEQFLSEGSSTEIIASAAGRDFIESDLDRHSLFSSLGRSAPAYTVTHWATSFERYGAAAKSTATAIFEGFRRETDYGITFVQTPGHTPDSLAWYDEAEMHLFVGDSLYEEGEDGMMIIWPREGDLREWYYSMTKLLQFVRAKMYRPESSTARAVDEDEEVKDWVKMDRRIKLAAGHQTSSVDAEEILERLLTFWDRVIRGDVPVVKKGFWQGEKVYTWRDESSGPASMSFRAPLRLMREAQAFFVGQD